jgi:acid stress-induced BolA-like protein IbaG/YrbA
MMPIPNSHPLRRWLAGLVENTFHAEVGLCEPAVLDYIAELLTEFIHVERINVAGDGSHRSVEDLAELLCQAQAKVGMSEDRRRELYRHIGDYTLFWTGVYPENLRRMHRRHTQDDLLDFFEQGKRSYAIASELSDDAMTPPALVLRSLSDQFEYCVYGLGLVRRNWEQGPPADGLPPTILH